MGRLIWIPFLSILTIASGWLSVKNNNYTGNLYSIWMYCIGLFPLWVLISKYSRNLVMDALIYDALVAILYVVSIIYFSGKSMSPMNWCGIILVTIGILMNRS